MNRVIVSSPTFSWLRPGHNSYGNPVNSVITSLSPFKVFQKRLPTTSKFPHCTHNHSHSRWSMHQKPLYKERKIIIGTNNALPFPRWYLANPTSSILTLHILVDHHLVSFAMQSIKYCCIVFLFYGFWCFFLCGYSDKPTLEDESGCKSPRYMWNNHYPDFRSI